MNYEQYLFSQLLALFDFDFAELPYDLQYAEALEKYEIFVNSGYDNSNTSLYDCIVKYLKNKYQKN